MTKIKYIGHRQTYREGCYGSGIGFIKGEAVNIEDDALASKLLRHPDVYIKADDESASTVVPVQKNASDTEDAAQDARDAIMAMSKVALTAYAKTNFSTSLDQTKKVGELRLQVVGLYDQFGVE